MKTAPRSMLTAPVEHAVREYALGLADRATAAADRLSDDQDTEALHDFRVAVRRLRTFLRAYGSSVPVGRKLERRLRRLARDTNGPRDAEVLLAWLAKQKLDLGARERPGVTWFMESLQREKAAAYVGIRGKIPPRWAKTKRGLQAALAPAATDLFHDAFGDVSAGLLDRYCGQLEKRLARVHTIADEAEAHAARLAAKRVRYLLEPFRGVVPDAKVLTKTFARMQDALGEMNDLRVMLARLREATRDAAAQRAEGLFLLEVASDPEALGAQGDPRLDERHGLVALARAAEARRAELFATVQKTYLDDGLAPLLHRCRVLSHELRAADAGAPPAHVTPSNNGA